MEASLTGWKESRWPRTWQRELTAALARVVQDAHDRGIIHRDLKPANVLVSGSRNAPLDPARLKLTDFGLAKRLDAEEPTSATSPGVIIGTPSYMAPELATGRAAESGPAVDIYGLGAILYELLTGQPPFCGESPLDTLRQVVNRPPVAPSQLNPEILPAIEAICLRCLEKEPAARYATAQDLAVELERFAARGHVVPSQPQAVASDRRRYRGKVLASLAVLAVAAVLGTVLFRVENRPTGEALQRQQFSSLHPRVARGFPRARVTGAKEKLSLPDRWRRWQRDQRWLPSTLAVTSIVATLTYH